MYIQAPQHVLRSGVSGEILSNLTYTHPPPPLCTRTAAHTLRSMAEAPSSSSLEPSTLVRLPSAELDKLSEAECWWRDHQVWLAEQGYMLRPRYRPDWKPSWNIQPKLLRSMHEDYHALEVCKFSHSIVPNSDVWNISDLPFWMLFALQTTVW